MFAPASNFDTQRHPSPEEVAGFLQYLPSSQHVLQRINGLLQKDDLSFDHMSSLLRLDPGLNIRVLEMGNQLAAAREGHCYSIEEAMNQIGFESISVLITRIAQEQVLVKPVAMYGIDADEFWRWSVSCAIGAELLAERTGEDMGVAYTAGLLHSVGIVAIDAWASAHAPTLMFMSRGGAKEYIESERALLGFTQAEVGAALLKQRGFPATMFEPLRWQYTPFASAGYARMACLLHAAKWLRAAVCTRDGARPPAMPDAVVLRPLRLSGEMLARMVVEVRVRLGAVRNLLQEKAA